MRAKASWSEMAGRGRNKIVRVGLCGKGRSSRVSITLFPRLKAAGQWGALERLTRPRGNGTFRSLRMPTVKRRRARSIGERGARRCRENYSERAPNDRLRFINPPGLKLFPQLAGAEIARGPARPFYECTLTEEKKKRRYDPLS